tara:strand:+ start:6856 stop:12969 length:6114 start_codon:yes stop_codon:yes gene_type:complete
MSGPACPYNYTGKFLDDERINDVCDDPIELGRKIHAMQPYDTALYRKHDPRRVSKTVIIRDYGCKVPITLADTEHIARAVLNNYPDRYVDFLKEFVSNIMGEAMKKYLVTYRDALNKILENQTDLNRVSWGAYKNVQGGHSPHLTSSSDVTADEVFGVDCSLPWDDHITKALNSIIYKTGDTMTGSLTASDVFDMRPCIQQHIATLEDMSSLWCQGFATKERFALAMIWWCNEQGRNLSQDLSLLKNNDHPDYNLIELHVPVNPFHMTPPTNAVNNLSADQNCAIRAELNERNRNTNEHKMMETVAFRVPVGQWTGNNETPNVIMSSSKSRYSWGWGHPANLTVNVRIQGKNEPNELDDLTQDEKGDTTIIMCAPYLMYEFENDVIRRDKLNINTGDNGYNQGTFSLTKHSCSTEYVRDHRWGSAFAGEKAKAGSSKQGAKSVPIIASAMKRKNRTLRESLGADDDVRSSTSFYRGTSDRTFGGMMTIADRDQHWTIEQIKSGDAVDIETGAAGDISKTTCKSTPRKSPVITNDPGVCVPDGISIVRKTFSGSCRHLDPFFSNGPNCLVTTVDDKVPTDRVIDVLIKSRCFSFYNVSEIGRSSYFKDIMRSAMLKVRKFASTNSRLFPSADVDAYINSYVNANGNYPFRTTIPPFAFMGSSNGSILPFAELYTSAAEQHRIFNSNFNSDLIVNQPFVNSFCINMNNVDWNRTERGGPGNKGYTDLLMNDVKATTNMKLAMRIIAIRTTLSVIFGMDAAALICEEPIQSNRPVLWKSNGENEFWCTPQSTNKCFIDRDIPHSDSDKLMRATTGAWKHAFWNEFYNAKHQDNNVIFMDKNETTMIPDDEMQTIITRSMLNCIMMRLKYFLKMTAIGETTIDGKHAMDRLYTSTQSHLLRMSIVSRFVSETHIEKLEKNNVNMDELNYFQDNGNDGDGENVEGTELNYRHNANILEKLNGEYQRKTFYHINCAIKDGSSEDNPETDHFPYDVAFHGHIGAINGKDTSLETMTKEKDGAKFESPFNPFVIDEEKSSSHMNMIKTLFRDPRAFYAFNASEWKAQCNGHMNEFNGDILHEFTKLDAGKFTIPYFRNFNDETSKSKNCVGIPQVSAAAYLIAHYEDAEERDNKIQDDNFKSACTNYIGHIVKHAAKCLKEQSHYLTVLESLISSDGSNAPSGDEIGDIYGASSSPRAPVIGSRPINDLLDDPNTPIVKLSCTEANNSFDQGTTAYFPICPTKFETRSAVIENSSLSSRQLRRLPVAGATTLGSGTTSFKCPRFSIIPVGNNPGYGNFDKMLQDNKNMLYNVDCRRPQMFAMIDAAGLLWHAREFVNPSDCNRPTVTEVGQCDGMHYWCRTLVETFVSAREIYRERESTSMWEIDVKKHPASALPASLIGNICDDTWRAYFPLLPFDHELREDLRKCRALSILWGTLPTYSSGSDSSGNSGAWMPLAPAHQMRLYGTVGLFDGKFRVPKNPWLPNNGTGISLIFNQSYHSVYHCDSYRAEHFQDWLVNANRYQVPHVQQTGCTYPFSQYGGTPVEADFVPHIVERCRNSSLSGRHRQLIYNRFGFTNPLRIGNQFHDTGLLQDMFQYKYRAYADISTKQRQMPEANAVHISNFMSYARTHAIIALASCNHGTEDESVPRIVRNLYRLYVDTYECMGSNTDDDSVPCIMGFSPSPINKRDDRGVVLYAGSLACLNSKISTFCSSSMNRGERVCSVYKQVYLNDATLLYTRLLRQERRKILHDNNFNRARIKRGRGYERPDFDRDLVDLQDAYIEFLQNTVLGMLLEGGADLQGVPLHLLEPRELEVSLFQEDDNLVGNDFLTPRTKEIIAQSDFGGDNLTRSQLAILSLIPPNHRVLGTLRLNQSMEIVDLEHAKKQIQKETMEGNKKVWQRYSEGLISAAFAQKLLEVDGPIDFSLDMSSIQDPMQMRFDMKDFKDPLKESENIKTRMTTTHAQSSSSLSLNQREEKLRKSTAGDSVLSMTTKEMNKALGLVRERVERDYNTHKGTKRRIQILEMLRIPSHVRRILRPEYEGDMV